MPFQEPIRGCWNASLLDKHGKHNIVSLVQSPGKLKGAASYAGLGAVAMFFSNQYLYEAKLGTYTELYAGLSSDLTLEKNGVYVIPWGRIRLTEAC